MGVDPPNHSLPPPPPSRWEIDEHKKGSIYDAEKIDTKGRGELLGKKGATTAFQKANLAGKKQSPPAEDLENCKMGKLYYQANSMNERGRHLTLDGQGLDIKKPLSA